MSTEDMQRIMYPTRLIMKPLVRLGMASMAAWFVYLAVTPTKTVGRIPPNYAEYRRQKGLSDTPADHPFGGAIKEQRIIPPDEIPYRQVN